MLRRLLNVASIVCLVACVALMGMWVRSYWWTEQCFAPISASQFVGTVSAPGEIGFGTGQLVYLHHPLWIPVTTPADMKYRPYMNSKRSTVWGRFEIVPGGFFVPYWFLVLSSGFLSAFLWRIRSRRFTLRSMFVAMTFLAVALGMIAWLNRP